MEKRRMIAARALAKKALRVEEDKRNKKRLEKGKWWWLRSNHFFELTPLSGYIFISVSKSKVEIIFWYLLILVFSIITINNVTTACLVYLSKPTRTYVQPQVWTRNVSLANFTLTLKASVMEFLPQHPIIPLKPSDAYISANTKSHLYEYYVCKNEMALTAEDQELFNEYLDERIFNATQYLSPLLASVVEKATGSTETIANDYSDLFPEGSDMLEMEIPANPMEMTTLSDTRSASAWAHEFLVSFEEVWAFWESNRDAMISEDMVDETMDKMTTALDKKRWHGLGKLLLLQQLKERNLLNMAHRFENPETDKLRKTKGEQILGALKIPSATHLLYHCIQLLASAIRFETDAQVFLQDFQYEKELEKLEIKTHVTVPPTSAGVTIKVHSFIHTWFAYLLKVLLQEGAECDGVAGEFDFNTNELQPNIYRAMIAFFNQHYSLKIQTHRGNNLEMVPFRNYQLKIKPTGMYNAQVENCYDSSYEYCMSDCIDQEYKDSCRCFRWDFVHINNDDKSPWPICEHKCLAIDELKCEEKCVGLLAHPCLISNYQLESLIAEWPLVDLLSNPESPIFQFNIERETVYNHPGFIEIYQSSIGEFMAEIGGLIEFWSGMSVVGIIHLVVYMIKQFRHMMRPGTVTGHTIRRILAMQTYDPDAVVMKSIGWNRANKHVKPVVEMRLANLELQLRNMLGDSYGEAVAAADKRPPEEQVKETKEGYKEVYLVIAQFEEMKRNDKAEQDMLKGQMGEMETRLKQRLQAELDALAREMDFQVQVEIDRQMSQGKK